MGLLHSLLSATLIRQTTRDRLAFVDATKQPAATQRDLLMGLLRQHGPTDFGRDAGFADLRTEAQFAERLGINGFDRFEPYIERVLAGQLDAMFADEPLAMFALSSGTTKARKYIPVTQRYLSDYRRSWRMWGLTTFESHPDLFLRAKIGFGAAAEEFRTAHGVPCGNLSGLTAQTNPWLVRQSYCLPAGSSDEFEAADRCYLNWRVGLLRDVGMCVAPNPGLLVQFGGYGTEHQGRLIRDVHDGACGLSDRFTPALAKSLRRLLRPNRKRAAELEAIASRTGGLLPKDVWPGLGLLCCWLGGPTAAYVDRLASLYGDIPRRDIGLIASEARMSIPKDDDTPGGILDVTSTYFEFIPVEQIDDPDPAVLGIEEVQEGRDYYLLLTTTSGLYRYSIQDVVRVTGFFERTPIVEFLHKGSRVANLFGEKVSERQVVEAARRAADSLGLPIGDFGVVPVPDGDQPAYRLLVEHTTVGGESAARDLAASFDARLCEANYLYARKREEGLLGEAVAGVLPDRTWQRWDREQMARSGGSHDQYKHPFLIGETGRVTDLLALASAALAATP